MDDCIMNDGVSTIDDSSVAVSWEDSSVERSVARDDAAPSVVEEEEVDEAVLTSIYEFAGLDQSSSGEEIVIMQWTRIAVPSRLVISARVSILNVLRFLSDIQRVSQFT